MPMPESGITTSYYLRCERLGLLPCCNELVMVTAANGRRKHIPHKGLRVLNQRPLVVPAKDALQHCMWHTCQTSAPFRSSQHDAYCQHAWVLVPPGAAPAARRHSLLSPPRSLGCRPGAPPAQAATHTTCWRGASHSAALTCIPCRSTWTKWHAGAACMRSAAARAPAGRNCAGMPQGAAHTGT